MGKYPGKDTSSPAITQEKDPLNRHFGALARYSDRLHSLLNGRTGISAAAPPDTEAELTAKSAPVDTQLAPVDAQLAPVDTQLTPVDAQLTPVDAQLTPENNCLKTAHYPGAPELYYLFNEGDSRYDGVINLPQKSSLYEYDAWGGRELELDCWNHGDKSYVNLSIDPGKSMIIVNGEPDETALHAPLFLTGDKTKQREFVRSVCKCADYPSFSRCRRIKKPEKYSVKHKRFPIVIRYETAFSLESFVQVALEITDAFEAVEVFVNDNSAGVQIVPVFAFDLTEFCRPGENRLVIEVATTYERDRDKQKKAAPAGITGTVSLYVK